MLRHLDLSDNHIGDSGASAIAEAASRLEQLAWLNLGGNLITKHGADSLATALSAPAL